MLTLNLPRVDDCRAESLRCVLDYYVRQLPISAFPGNDIARRRGPLVPQPAKKFLRVFVIQFVIQPFLLFPSFEIIDYRFCSTQRFYETRTISGLIMG